MSTQTRKRVKLATSWKNPAYDHIPWWPSQTDKQMLAQRIGSEIVSMRYGRHISQTELAQLIDSDQSSIARLEAGTSLPSIRFLQRIAFALQETITVTIPWQTAPTAQHKPE
jgi:ribosome-binding protein aMBF1 (putative translation factor)